MPIAFICQGGPVSNAKYSILREAQIQKWYVEKRGELSTESAGDHNELCLCVPLQLLWEMINQLLQSKKTNTSIMLN